MEKKFFQALKSGCLEIQQTTRDKLSMIPFKEEEKEEEE